MGPMKSEDYYQRLTSTVITLSGFHCTTIAMLLSEKCSIIFVTPHFWSQVNPRIIVRIV